MATLIVVESPTKAKAIQSYAGPGHTVKASFGHVRDLPKKELGIDLEAGFAPRYLITNRKAIQTLRAALEKADTVILASDPDREGEAIAWHIAEALRKELRGKTVLRAVFHEITPTAVRAGLASPRAIDMALVNAQQARRVLDRLVGYKVSPLLWKQIKRPWVGGKKPPALSAGRVQSVALRLVVERDREIEVFKPEEYWTLDVELAANQAHFKARLIPKDPQADAQSTSQEKAAHGAEVLRSEARSAQAKANENQADEARQEADSPFRLSQQAVTAAMDDLQDVPWRVGQVSQKQERRYPYPPFTTSTLQQAASARLGWNPKKTMKVAQELFEGVRLMSEPEPDPSGSPSEAAPHTAAAHTAAPHEAAAHEAAAPSAETPKKGKGRAGTVMGLITYMRTDSTSVSPEAQEAARQMIQKYWPKSLPDKPPVYKTKVANAQEAHEAIRPTDPARTPKALRDQLSPEQSALYEIIWRRFIASQMKPAIYSVTTVDIPVRGKSGKDYLFRAIGRVLLDPGFLAVYEMDEESGQKARGEQETRLPPLKAGDALRFIRFIPEKHLTEPPRRYSQAGLIRELEKRGLGRPSTYASIVETLLEREYVAVQRQAGPSAGKGKMLQSTEVGRQVLDFLLERFPDVFDYQFTAQMEDQLDQVAGGGARWQVVLAEFWKTLGPRVSA